MNSNGFAQDFALTSKLKKYGQNLWIGLDDKQQQVLKKTFGIITYKWRWQIAMNIPYLAIYVLHRTVPAVHKFDMNVLASINSKIPLPSFIASWLGLG